MEEKGGKTRRVALLGVFMDYRDLGKVWPGHFRETAAAKVLDRQTMPARGVMRCRIVGVAVAVVLVLVLVVLVAVAGQIYRGRNKHDARKNHRQHC